MKRTIALLALLTAFPPLSTDMYLPALPALQRTWQQPLVTINLTLIGFFVTYCVFMLIYGPVSDRLGRRRPLMAGIGLYVVASLLCALATNVWTLIAFRVLQAAGAAAATSLSLAITRDLFEAHLRAKIISIIAIIIALAPMMAPVLGGWIMTVADWPYVFISQALMGTVALIGVFRMNESLQDLETEPIRRIFSAYGRLFKNRRFTAINLAFSLVSLVVFSFIAGASDIYMTRFGLSESEFGYYFGFNATALMCGAFFFNRFSAIISTRGILACCFAGILAGGAWMTAAPHHGPLALALPMWCIGFFIGMSRPPSISLTLEQVNRDTGAASALITFCFMLIGSGGMGLISLEWTDKITVVGVLAVAVGAVNLAFWAIFSARYQAAPLPPA